MDVGFLDGFSVLFLSCAFVVKDLQYIYIYIYIGVTYLMVMLTFIS